MKKQSHISVFLFYFIIFGILLISASMLFRTDAGTSLQYSDVVDLFENEQVTSFLVDDRDNLILQLRTPLDGQTVAVYRLSDVSRFREELEPLIRSQYAAGILTSYDFQPEYETPWILTVLPYILVAIALIIVFLILMNRANGGGNMVQFGKANARFGTDPSKKVTFADVAGADEEKQELQEIVEFLRSPKKFTALGARIPKGVLLVGPPGTGKTLIAKAVAGEADVQFLSISGSDFVELYVGVGASRVRDLFSQAKKVAPAIIFIDEIDAVGRKRGAGLGGGHDEREQTLNQLLVEMDGFGQNEGVVVMAATNRPDILDSALLRPGRFDRQIYVGAPDAKGREEILKVHSRQKPLAEDVNLEAIAKMTAGFTGADLANLLNEAALLAARIGRPYITMEDLESSMIKVIAGPEKRSRRISAHERKLTAIHEAGHAVAMYYLPTHDPVHQITIIPRGGAGGMTISLPSDDRNFASRNEMLESIISFLGGRVAEQLFLDDISTGASDDLRRATAIARDMVTKYGMSQRLGAVSYESGGEVFIGRDYEKTKAYSERVAGNIDEEVHTLMEQAYNRCTEILKEHANKLLAVSDYLLAHETMGREEFEAMMAQPDDAVPSPVTS